MTLNQDIFALNEKIVQESVLVNNLTAEVGKVIVGQQNIIERLLIGLFTNGHILIEEVDVLDRIEVMKADVDIQIFTPVIPYPLIDNLVARFHRLDPIRAGAQGRLQGGGIEFPVLPIVLRHG